MGQFAIRWRLPLLFKDFVMPTRTGPRKLMDILLRVLLITAGVLAALIFLLWLGLQIKPAPFAPYPQKTGKIETVPLPAGLPAPVERFYRKLYGDQIPVITSAVITGRAQLRPAGPAYLPSRFRFTHIAGQSYRHYIESTIFTIPVFKINERYVNGVSRFELPFFGVTENDPKINQGANLGMWSESVWMPSLFLTDPRVRWDPVDNETALLTVPFEDTIERYVVRFDPKTDMIHYFESMRYHGAESTEKVLWLNDTLGWKEINGMPIGYIGAATWMDNGTPWAIFTVEDIVYNVDVADYILREGP